MISLEAENISKTFEGAVEPVHVLRGVSLTLRRGEVVTLEGPSGSGKTTLLCVLGCMLTPTSGRLVIEGKEVDPGRPGAYEWFRREAIGFVFQQFNLFPSLTALENVEYVLNVKGKRGRVARAEARRALEVVGLADRGSFKPRELSGGQKQRVAIARALAGNPSVILADEPTANLDARMGVQILQLFRQLAVEENRALLIVTHDAKVRDVADRVLVMNEGTLSETPHELADETGRDVVRNAGA